MAHTSIKSAFTGLLSAWVVDGEVIFKSTPSDSVNPKSMKLDMPTLSCESPAINAGRSEG